MKICSKCKQEKPLKDFGKDKRKPDGHKYQCKDCHNSQNKAFRRANPDQYRKANLAYARSSVGKTKQRANSLRRKFWPHLTNEQAVAEYARLLEEQKGCCALCGKHQAEFKIALSVDHNGKTGKIRGLLCNKCNRFEVGRHDLESARKMLEYFIKHEGE